MASLIISPSGFRGIIGDTLTPDTALTIGASFGHFIGKGPVVIGGDTRVSHDSILSAVISGLLAVGTDVIHIGKVTTPTVQQSIKIHRAKGGLVITASHNPIMWNGIKLMNETGSFLTDKQYDDFISAYTNKTFTYTSWDKQGTLSHDTTAIQTHVQLILDKIDTAPIRNSSLRVLIDANNGAGAVADPILMDALGIEYTILNNEPHGKFNHDPEPLQKNLSEIINEMKTGKYDIGFAQDADADRLVILDEKGHFIGEDYSLGFCIDYVLRYEKNNIPKKEVVVNLSTSKLISDIVESHQGTVYQTRIGEPHVTGKLKALNATVGGEGNGGIIYPEIGWGRDSLVGIVLALNYLAKSKQKVSDIVSTYPKYIMLREKLTVKNQDHTTQFIEKVKGHYENFELNEEDGVKVLFPTGWIHVRPSNTEPILRIFIEEQSIAQANIHMEEILSL